jgi:hypothetical protein
LVSIFAAATAAAAIIITMINALQWKYSACKMYKQKLMPVIVESTVTISKSFRKYLNNVPGKHEIKELQKTAILGTAHILREVLM